ncbi:MAG: hypothetical protein LUC33_02590, partial [Prevotellaceae bacterium]|nr:hypothetical protein [Prevotellaceae bacterium]
MIAQDKEGNWVLTAYDSSRKAEEKKKGAPTPVTAGKPAEADGARAVTPNLSAGKGSQKGNSAQEKGGKNEGAPQIGPVRKGRLLERAREKMSAAAKAVSEKVLKKVGLKDFLAKKKDKALYKYIYYKDGYGYATDGWQLIKFKADYPKEWEGKVVLDNKVTDTGSTFGAGSMEDVLGKMLGSDGVRRVDPEGIRKSLAAIRSTLYEGKKKKEHPLNDRYFQSVPFQLVALDGGADTDGRRYITLSDEMLETAMRLVDNAENAEVYTTPEVLAVTADGMTAIFRNAKLSPEQEYAVWKDGRLFLSDFGRGKIAHEAWKLLPEKAETPEEAERIRQQRKELERLLSEAGDLDRDPYFQIVEKEGGRPADTEGGDTGESGGDVTAEEKDENGMPFVRSSDGSTVFGEIGEESGLPAGPIKLSEGRITNPATNAGYGRVHIDARHGDEIRAAGFGSVEEFVDYVSKNWTRIVEGNQRAGKKTYLLEVSADDKHNDTLMVELSRDSGYWNVNTAGVFNKGYSEKKKEVFSRPAAATRSATTGEVTPPAAQNGGEATEARKEISSPTPSSERKGSQKGNTAQGNGGENEGKPSRPKWLWADLGDVEYTAEKEIDGGFVSRIAKKNGRTLVDTYLNGHLWESKVFDKDGNLEAYAELYDNGMPRYLQNNYEEIAYDSNGSVVRHVLYGDHQLNVEDYYTNGRLTARAYTTDNGTDHTDYFDESGNIVGSSGIGEEEAKTEGERLAALNDLLRRAREWNKEYGIEGEREDAVPNWKLKGRSGDYWKGKTITDDFAQVRHLGRNLVEEPKPVGKEQPSEGGTRFRETDPDKVGEATDKAIAES